MRRKAPANMNELSLSAVLGLIEYTSQKKSVENNREISLFIGIDEYQKIGEKYLLRLIQTLCDASRRKPRSKLTLYTMLSGTDLNLTRIATASYPNTKRIPITFLTYAEAMEAIGPFISKRHPGFTINESFTQNVFYLGGVPRLLTKFALKVVELSPAELSDEMRLTKIRNSIIANLPQISIPNFLLATSFTNQQINNPLEKPFPDSNNGT
jgi:hypothetical protein